MSKKITVEKITIEKLRFFCNECHTEFTLSQLQIEEEETEDFLYCPNCSESAFTVSISTKKPE